METLFSFTSYGILVTLSLLAGLIAGAVYLYRARAFAPHVLLTFCVLLVPCVWFFSRLFFVLANCTYYLTTLSNPALALRFWDGGYSMTGAFAGACVGAWLTARIRGLSVPLTLDAVGIGFPFAVIFARLSEYGTGLGEGRPITGGWIPPLASEIYDGYLHPVFLYEAVAALLIFLTLLLVARSHHGHPHEGDLFLLCMTMYGLTQSFLESLRDDGHMVVHFVRIQQVLAILMALISLFVWCRRSRRYRKDIWIVSVVTVLSIGLAVLSEFGVDRWGNRALAYGLMLGCLLAILICSLHMYRRTFMAEPGTDGTAAGLRADTKDK